MPDVHERPEGEPEHDTEGGKGSAAAQGVSCGPATRPQPPRPASAACAGPGRGRNSTRVRRGRRLRSRGAARAPHLPRRRSPSPAARARNRREDHAARRREAAEGRDEREGRDGARAALESRAPATRTAMRRADGEAPRAGSSAAQAAAARAPPWRRRSPSARRGGYPQPPAPPRRARRAGPPAARGRGWRSGRRGPRPRGQRATPASTALRSGSSPGRLVETRRVELGDRHGGDSEPLALSARQVTRVTTAGEPGRPSAPSSTPARPVLPPTASATSSRTVLPNEVAARILERYPARPLRVTVPACGSRSRPQASRAWSSPTVPGLRGRRFRRGRRSDRPPSRTGTPGRCANDTPLSATTPGLCNRLSQGASAVGAGDVGEVYRGRLAASQAFRLRFRGVEERRPPSTKSMRVARDGALDPLLRQDDRSTQAFRRRRSDPLPRGRAATSARRAGGSGSRATARRGKRAGARRRGSLVRRSRRCVASTPARAAATRGQMATGSALGFSEAERDLVGRPAATTLILRILEDRGDPSRRLGRARSTGVAPADLGRPAKRPPWK